MRGRRCQPAGGGSVFGGGLAIFQEIVFSGAARGSKESADPTELSGGTRLGFEGAFSNINYAFLVFGWGTGFCKTFQKGSVQAERVAEGF